MTEVTTARNGELTASVSGARLYSAYNPSREVDAFLDRQALSSPRTLILISDGLGHLEQSVSRRFPGARVVSIHLSKRISQRLSTPTRAWRPGLSVSVRRFLAGTLTEDDIDDLEVIAWPAAAKCFRPEYEGAVAAIRELLDRLARSRLTTRYFGARWIRNLVRNSRRFPGRATVTTPVVTRRPLIVLAPGPTLERVLPVVAERRDRLCVVAVSSALSVLWAHGLQADIVVHTDPSYYARLHLYERTGSTEAILCMPLTAQPPLRENELWLPVSNALSIEEDAHRHLGIEPVVIPEAGTVSSTALRLALDISKRDIYIAGLDFCYYDLRSHARGYSFEPFIQERASRLHPAHTEYYLRAIPAHRDSGRIRRAPNFDVYAAWFAEFSSTSRRVIRLEPSDVATGGRTCSLEDFRREVDNQPSRSPPALEQFGTATFRSDETTVDSLIARWVAILRSDMPGQQGADSAFAGNPVRSKLRNELSQLLQSSDRRDEPACADRLKELTREQLNRRAEST